MLSYLVHHIWNIWSALVMYSLHLITRLPSISIVLWVYTWKGQLRSKMIVVLHIFLFLLPKFTARCQPGFFTKIKDLLLFHPRFLSVQAQVSFCSSPVWFEPSIYISFSHHWGIQLQNYWQSYNMGFLLASQSFAFNFSVLEKGKWRQEDESDMLMPTGGLWNYSPYPSGDKGPWQNMKEIHDQCKEI